jgi:hypothetical protein
MPTDVQNNLLVDYMYIAAEFVVNITNASIAFVKHVSKDGYQMFCELYNDAREIINQFFGGLYYVDKKCN